VLKENSLSDVTCIGFVSIRIGGGGGSLICLASGTKGFRGGRGFWAVIVMGEEEEDVGGGGCDFCGSTIVGFTTFLGFLFFFGSILTGALDFYQSELD
jgi:hypothetical protein